MIAASAAMADPITFTLDLEDHRAERGGPPRYADNTRRVLDLLDQWAVRGTVFTVGEIADASPELLRDAAARGHEIGFHSACHRPLTDEHPSRFREQTRSGRARLQDVTGQAVHGYRAPVFSLTPATRWCTDVLLEIGFGYSSSALPARNPLHGYPGLPPSPFRWPCGLLELPVPVAALGPLRFPYLGGFYLRYLPLRLVRRLHAHAPPTQCSWTYCHPYDFDAEEPFCRIRGASLWVSVLLWLNRGGTADKLGALLAGEAAPPLGDRIARGDFAHAPVLEAAARASR